MAQQSSVPGPPCAVHRYCHSPAFISGQVCLVQLVKREAIRGVRSMGSRLVNRQWDSCDSSDCSDKLDLACAKVLDGEET
jgi:hypothetical protein